MLLSPLPPQPCPLPSSMPLSKDPGKLFQMPEAMGTKAISLRSPWGSSQEYGLTIKARIDDLLGPGQPILLFHLLQD